MEITEIIEAFTLIGEDDEGSILDFGSKDPGTVQAVTQTLFLGRDEDWQKSDNPIGFADGIAMVSRRDERVVCHIVFTVQQDHSIVVSGILPLKEGRLSDGVLAITGGTGQFSRVGGRCTVDVVNPKRYHFTF